jgi:hypothetical protein
VCYIKSAANYAVLLNPVNKEFTMRELNTKEVDVVSGGTIFATIGKTLDGIVNGIFNSELSLGETIGKVLDTPFDIIKNIFDSIFKPS